MAPELTARHRELMHKELKNQCELSVNSRVTKPEHNRFGLPLRSQEINDAVEAVKKGKSVSLDAPSRFHKTTVIQAVLDNLAADGFKVLLVDMQASSPQNILPHPTKTLTKEEQTELPSGYSESITDKDVAKAIEEGFKGKDKVLIIDEFAYVKENKAQERAFCELIPKLRKNGVKIILGLHPGAGEYEELLGEEGKDFKRVQLEALSPEDEEVILDHANIPSKELREKIKKEFGGHPYLYHTLRKAAFDAKWNEIEGIFNGIHGRAAREKKAATIKLGAGTVNSILEEIKETIRNPTTGGSMGIEINEMYGKQDKAALESILKAGEGQEIDPDLHKQFRIVGIILKKDGKETVPPIVQEAVKKLV